MQPHSSVTLFLAAFWGCLLPHSSLALESTVGIALTPERAVNFRGVSDVAVSPDGSAVICAVSEITASGTGTTRQSHLWLTRLGKSELHQFTYSSKSERAPRWAPDSDRLAFLSDRTGPTQVYVMSRNGGEAHAVTAVAGGVSDFRWSPDGTQIAYLARSVDANHEAPHVVDREEDLERLWVLDLASKKVRELTGGTWRIDEFDWASADEILAIASEHPRTEIANTSLYEFAVANGSVMQVGQPNQPFGGLAISPGRHQFAFASTRGEGPLPHDLYVQGFGSPAAHNVTSSIDRMITETHWQTDSIVWVRVDDGFKDRLFRINANGAATPIELPYSVSSLDRTFDVASDGTVVFVGVSFSHLPELFSRSPSGRVSQMSHLQEGWEDIRLADPEVFRFKSFDGVSMEAALMTPPKTKSTTPLPLILLVHGGPGDHFKADYYWFNSWPQLLTARGYQVLMVNPRGSTGYGEEFLKANRADMGGGDFKDLMAALDTVIARGGTDPNRLGIGGWSYGGEMTLWAIGHTNRFRAAVDGAGVFDETAEVGTEDSYNAIADAWYLGWPWESPDVYAHNSPSTFISQAKTPTIIFHGEADHDNPIGQSQALYRALKHFGVETELITYPGEPHGPRQPQHQIDILSRMLDWFDRHLK